MWVIILFIVIAGAVFLLIATSTNKSNYESPIEKKNHDRAYLLSQFKVEAPNRIRIFNDSIRLVQSTQNVTTFIRRVKDIDEFTEWSFAQINNGMPLTTNGRNHLEMVKSYREMINRNAFRVAQAEFAKWSKVKRVNGKVFDTATVKVFSALDALSGSLESGDNKIEIQSEISEIRNLVEDIYSNINNTCNDTR